MEDTIVLIKIVTEKSQIDYLWYFSDSSVSNCSYNLALG